MYFKKSKKVFIHVDCDSFFASCEVLRRPELKGKKVCVWNDIIIASSYEAKKLWVKVWTPIWEAKSILWDRAYYFPPDHNFYSLISDKIEKYLSYNTLSYEPFSIDEWFCDITWLPELYKMSLYSYLKKLQKDILKEIWVPVSIWCSNTRIKAKIYSKINKPNGIFIWIDQDIEKENFKKMPLKEIPFIWRSSQEKLKYSCENIYDFIQLGYWYIKKVLWKNGTDLWLELVWVNAFVVKKSKNTKSISRTRSFNHNITSDIEFLKAQILLNFERVYREIIEKDFEVKTLSVMLRDKSFNTYYYDFSFSEHTNLRHILLTITLRLFENIYNKNILYRSTGVIFSWLRSFLPRQTSIFDTPLRSKDQNYILNKTINQLNAKYNKNKIAFWTSLLWVWDEAKLWIRK